MNRTAKRSPVESVIEKFIDRFVLYGSLLSLVILLVQFGRVSENRSESAISGYYTRLPFDDSGFTGKYPASSCPSTLNEVRRIIDNKTIEAIDIYGLTNNSVASLTSLNRSWNFAPEVTDIKGCINLGYEKRERAYKFLRQVDRISFKILATRDKPVANLALIINNWKSYKPDDFSLSLNGKLLNPGSDYRKGIETDTDGKNVLVLWLEYSSSEKTSILIH